MRRYLLIPLTILLFADFISCLIYSITGIIFLSKFLLFLIEILFFVIPILLAYKYKILAYKKFQYFYFIIFMMIIYIIIGIINDGITFSALKTFRTVIVPFLLIIYGTFLRKINFSFIRILRTYIIFAIFISLYGLCEVFIFNELSFYSNILDISGYFTDVKNQPMGIDATKYSKSSFRALGINYRLNGVFLEPLSTAFMIVGAITLILHNKFMNGVSFIKNSNLILVLLFIALFFTQTRSSLIFLLLSLIPISLKNKKAFIINSFFFIIISISIILFMQQMIFEIIYGETKHWSGFIGFYQSLFNEEYFLGMGIGNITIEESGFGYYYSQFGYLGLILFLLIIFSYFMKSIRLKDSYINTYASGILFSILVINNIHYYHNNIKGFSFIWIIIGFVTVYKKQIKRLYKTNYLSLE